MARLPLVSPLDRVLFFRAHPVFQPLDPATLVVLASHARERPFEEGDVLLDEESEERGIYIIGEGAVEVSWSGGARWTVEAPGGVGVLHVVAESDQRNGAVALSSGMALRLDAEDYLQILEDHFELATRILFVNARLSSRAERRLGWSAGASAPPPPPSEPMPEKLDLVQKLSLARRAELFREANLQLLTELFRGESERRFEAGETLQRAGESAEGFELIVHGTVRVCDAAGSRTGWLGAEELVGLADLFTEEPRPWTAVAETPLLTLHVDKTLYVDVLEDYFDHLRALMAMQARRFLERRVRLAGEEGEPSLALFRSGAEEPDPAAAAPGGAPAGPTPNRAR